MHLSWTANPLWVLINSLVAYRITRLWVEDTLPPIPLVRAWITRWATARVEQQYDRAQQIDARRPLSEPRRAATERVFTRLARTGGDHPVLYLISCYWCSGFWISAAVVVAASLVPATAWALIALPFAFSAVVGLLARLAE